MEVSSVDDIPRDYQQCRKRWNDHCREKLSHNRREQRWRRWSAPNASLNRTRGVSGWFNWYPRGGQLPMWVLSPWSELRMRILRRNIVLCNPLPQPSMCGWRRQMRDTPWHLHGGRR